MGSPVRTGPATPHQTMPDVGGAGAAAGGVAGAGGKSKEFTATAYGPPWNAMNGTGVTSGGTNLRDGKRKYIVAADPSVLPLGTRIHISPNPYNYRGTFLVDDTGGGVKGNHIDIYIAEGRAKQMAWGTKKVQVAPDGNVPQGFFEDHR
jgi:3D (Asp-Asp-Asp) domain-containing protein